MYFGSVRFHRGISMRRLSIRILQWVSIGSSVRLHEMGEVDSCFVPLCSFPDVVVYGVSESDVEHPEWEEAQRDYGFEPLKTDAASRPRKLGTCREVATRDHPRTSAIEMVLWDRDEVAHDDKTLETRLEALSSCMKELGELLQVRGWTSVYLHWAVVHHADAGWHQMRFDVLRDFAEKHNVRVMICYTMWRPSGNTLPRV